MPATIKLIVNSPKVKDQLTVRCHKRRETRRRASRWSPGPPLAQIRMVLEECLEIAADKDQAGDPETVPDRLDAGLC